MPPKKNNKRPRTNNKAIEPPVPLTNAVDEWYRRCGKDPNEWRLTEGDPLTIVVKEGGEEPFLVSPQMPIQDNARVGLDGSSRVSNSDTDNKVEVEAEDEADQPPRKKAVTSYMARDEDDVRGGDQDTDTIGAVIEAACLLDDLQYGPTHYVLSLSIEAVDGWDIFSESAKHKIASKVGTFINKAVYTGSAEPTWPCRSGGDPRLDFACTWTGPEDKLREITEAHIAAAHQMLETEMGVRPKKHLYIDAVLMRAVSRRSQHGAV